MPSYRPFAAFLLLAAVAPGARADSRSPDPHSFSRPDEVAVRHLELDLTVDFRIGALPAARR